MLLPQRRPHLHVDTDDARAGASSSHSVPFPKHDGFSHFHTSVVRAHQLEIQIHSPTIRSSHKNTYEPSKILPVFGDHDRVEGAVLLDPQQSSTPGKLSVTFEGAFIYLSPGAMKPSERMADARNSDKYRHLFFSSTITFSTGESGSPRSASSLRDAFTNSVRLRKTESSPNTAGSARPHFPFAFDIPRPGRPGEELPPTCCNVSLGIAGIRGRSAVERAEVEYKIVATWEDHDDKETARLEAPVIYQPDTDFQSLDGLYLEPDSWLEIPLRSDRPIPFKCAVTLPDPPTLPRSGYVPFFVVFTTRPRSSALAREIAADATIAVSLLRQITVLSGPSPLYSPTISASSVSSEDSDARITPKKSLLRRRIVKSSPSTPSGSLRSPQKPVPQDKPLPPIPHGISDMRSLHTDVCIGFPKRPRNRMASHRHHPSIEENAALPDGLYKGKLRLDKSMLPSIEWASLTVKYFVEVSVVLGQDELRVRVPVRIF
ncbi:uncharacterized protein PHACADRAFT_206848 [Phanerochaete carnosa HHB-10118-sp]|uniref:Uncharacterized protein n=1 Tax=Phanerochaete carnosa (strain HHB-10118-sp) TaxID=650164 RepID=K5V5Q2_PHACS|nr:uncharacterized protein PHACADRAFT_206848 [Phanerochaete carnosa HHB-10118-sp]EKM58006.1 hypothetical protein PHACADRAFT_206848 [Phanerochaete carnosa HHB-10118-sp]